MPILVKVNCELNGSFELRMYPCSECNVLLMKPALWLKKKKRLPEGGKNYHHWRCSVHLRLQPTPPTLIVLLWLADALWEASQITSGSCDMALACWTLNIWFLKWRVADISFVRIACGYIVENVFLFLKHLMENQKNVQKWFTWCLFPKGPDKQYNYKWKCAFG